MKKKMLSLQYEYHKYHKYNTCMLAKLYYLPMLY